MPQKACSLTHRCACIYRLLLSDNYMTQTKRHYQPHIRSDCPPLNIVNKSRESGFHQLRSHPKAVTEEEKVLTPTHKHNNTWERCREAPHQSIFLIICLLVCLLRQNTKDCVCHIISSQQVIKPGPAEDLSLCEF